MQKSDLKNGMVVETRNSTIWMVFNNTLQYKHGWEDLNDYDENLMSCGEDIPARINKEYDIIRVGKYIGSNIFNLELNDSNIKWMWEREEYELTDAELKMLKLLKEFGCEKVRKLKKELYGYTNSPYDNWGATLAITIDLNEYEHFVNKPLEFEVFDKLHGRSVDIDNLIKDSL